MLNKVQLIGYLGKDPEMRSTGSGTAVANFSLATSRRWRDRDGNRQEHTEWHALVAWDKLAETICQYLTKGSKVFVEGRLQTRWWEDKNTGEKRYKTEIVVDNFLFLDSKPRNDERAPQAHQETARSDDAYEDDDIPF